MLLTEQLTTPAGDPVDVYSYFEKDPSTLTLLRHNWYGILHTAQGVSRSSAIDQPAPEWPGFQTVWSRSQILAITRSARISARAASMAG